MLAKAVVSSEGLTRGNGESASNPAHAIWLASVPQHLNFSTKLPHNMAASFPREN